MLSDACRRWNLTVLLGWGVARVYLLKKIVNCDLNVSYPCKAQTKVCPFPGTSWCIIPECVKPTHEQLEWIFEEWRRRVAAHLIGKSIHNLPLHTDI